MFHFVTSRLFGVNWNLSFFWLNDKWLPMLLRIRWDHRAVLRNLAQRSILLLVDVNETAVAVFTLNHCVTQLDLCPINDIYRFIEKLLCGYRIICSLGGIYQPGIHFDLKILKLLFTRLSPSKLNLLKWFLHLLKV